MCKDTISVFQFMEMFPNEEKAIKWFEQKRWAGNPTCVHCESDKAYKTSRTEIYQCRSCKKIYRSNKHSYAPPERPTLAYRLTTIRHCQAFRSMAHKNSIYRTLLQKY